jgi:hypothetical protein
MIKDSKSNLIYIQQIWVSNKHKVSSESWIAQLWWKWSCWVAS